MTTGRIDQVASSNERAVHTPTAKDMPAAMGNRDLACAPLCIHTKPTSQELGNDDKAAKQRSKSRTRKVSTQIGEKQQGASVHGNLGRTSRTEPFTLGLNIAPTREGQISTRCAPCAQPPQL